MTQSEDIHDIQEVRRSFALTTSRIESLSDCIFAFAMTLLVLGFQLPLRTPASSLLHTLLNLQAQFTTYFLSFIVLGGLWISHHNQYFWIKKSNRTFLWINMIFLLFIALIPFSTKVLAGYPEEHAAIVIYGLNIIICLTMLYIHWMYATKKKLELVDNLNARITSLVEIRLTMLIILNILAVSVSFVSIAFGVGMLIIVQIFGAIPTVTIDRLIIRYKKITPKV
jgi:uncharacterized membrane protein